MKSSIIFLSVVCFATFIWGALYFFKTNNIGSKSGKNLISIVIGTCIVVTIINLSSIRQIRLTQFSVAGTFLIISLIIFLISVRSTSNVKFQFIGSDKVPDKIVTTGIYKYIRHPFYLSYILAWIGDFISQPNSISASVTALTFAIYYKSAVAEERSILSSAHRERYLSYISRSGRLMPKFINKNFA